MGEKMQQGNGNTKYFFVSRLSDSNPRQRTGKDDLLFIPVQIDPADM